jgi:subtilisin family serine protease
MPATARETTRLRLLVELPRSGSDERVALRDAVRRSLDPDARGRPWRIARLFDPDPTGAEAEAGRFLTVEGAVEVSPAYALNRVAFDRARQLAAASGFRVEPDLPTTIYDRRALDRVAPAFPRDGSSPASSAAAASLPKGWALEAIKAPAAWALPAPAGGLVNGQGVLVGHPDTGYTRHPEMVLGAMLDLTRDRDVISGDDDALDPLDEGFFGRGNPGHGTQTASVIASRGTGSVTGVARRATILPIRTITSVVQVFDGDVARAIDHARRSGCHVISMSLGGVGFRGLQAAVRLAVADGLIVLAAAGNEVGFVVAPANYPECIAVAATGPDDEPWDASSRGPEVAISAPGDAVWTARTRGSASRPTYDVRQGSGTSFAVAHVAGAAALWLAFRGRDALVRAYGKPAIQGVFRRLLQRTARRPAGWDAGNFGAGVLNAEALLAETPPSRATGRRQIVMAPALDDDVDRIARMLPELGRAEVEARLDAMLGPRAAPADAFAADNGAELAYLLAENAEVRDAFVGGGPGVAAAEGTAAADGARRALARHGSATLIRELG